ncbi:hypothetical protein Hte_004798 [Hypoxylon texense]
MFEPVNFGLYQTAISGGDGQEEPNAGAGGQDQPFKPKFEDVKEIHQNGEVLAVIRTQNQYKRKAGNKKFGEYSLLLRRIVDVNVIKPQLQLEIQSDILREQFRLLARGFTSINLHQDPIIIREPYQELYHCKDKIEEALGEASEEIRQHLQLLVEFQAQYMSYTIRTVDSFKNSGTIEFEWLWSLFTPGSLVIIQNTISTVEPIEWCAVLKSYNVVVQEGAVFWNISVTHTGFNGGKFGNVVSSFTFPSFAGVLNITQLQAYPLQFRSDKEALRDTMISRGRYYEQYCIASGKRSKPPIGTPMIYEGPFWRISPKDESRYSFQMLKPPSTTVKGRVIVDVDGFFNHYPGLRDSILPERSGGNDNNSSDDTSPCRWLQRSMTVESTLLTAGSPLKPLSTEQHLTCPPFVHVFSFTVREWGFVLINGLSEIKWNPGVFDKLQVKENVKETLRGLVNGHSHRSINFDDFIEGKGRGLVCLLHGPPGSGKTMTAESIAESLHKLLYSASGGELGTSVGTMQYRLEMAFKLVARWDAILLLDEADTFLAERRGDSVERNAIISGETSHNTTI